MLYFIAPIVIGLVVIAILSLAFKDAAKVDKGAELNYFKFRTDEK